MKLSNILDIIPENSKVTVIDDNNCYSFNSPDDIPLYVFRQEVKKIITSGYNTFTFIVTDNRKLNK